MAGAKFVGLIADSTKKDDENVQNSQTIKFYAVLPMRSKQLNN